VAKVTSKLQVTVPKALAERYGIHPGDEIEWVAAGEIIRVIPPRARTARPGREARLRLFEQAVKRHREWLATQPGWKKGAGRGWTREDLYDRGRAR
jgi:AbrB family looped-hinge helix DNA binding protein